MRAKRWAFFLGLNIVVSVLTTLLVLQFRGELERVVIVTATPTSAPPSEIPTAVPAGQPTRPSGSPTPSGAVEYVVQAGDTLGGIALAFDVSLEELLLANDLAEDSIIRSGEVLIIPRSDVTPAPAPLPSPSPAPQVAPVVTMTSLPVQTPTPSGPVQVRIQEVLAAGELGREGVVIINRGRTVNMQGWTLGAARGDLVYVFPRLTLAQEVPVTIYTIAGDDSPQALHWGLSEAQWGKTDTIIELRNAGGDLIATYAVP